MSEEMMNTKEVAKYLRIHEKQVYALIKTKRIPSTRVTGKWVFPRKLIEEWIESNAKTGLDEARQKSKRIEGGLLASGSNDHLFRRDLGFVVAPKNPFQIRGFEDLTQKGIRFVNRQKGSGTRVLLDQHLKRLQISPAKINGYRKEVYTHFEVGLSILSKEADVGVATIAISKLLGLRFIPITQESFDMILDQSTFFEKGVQAFMEVLNSHEFRNRVEKLGSYDFKNSGKVLYSRK